MEFFEVYFRIFQTANFLAASLLMFEVGSVVLRRYKSNDWDGPIVTFPMFLVASFATASIPMATFAPRIFDNGVFWLGLSTQPIFASFAITMMFCVVFWFVHYTRKEDHRRTMIARWRGEHISMLAIMSVSIVANVAELVGG